MGWTWCENDQIRSVTSFQDHGSNPCPQLAKYMPVVPSTDWIAIFIPKVDAAFRHSNKWFSLSVTCTEEKISVVRLGMDNSY